MENENVTPSSDGITPQGQTSQGQKNIGEAVPPIAGAKSKLDPPEDHKHPTEHCRPDQTPIGKYILEIATVGVVACYTWAAWQQLTVMRGQLSEIVRQYPEIQKSAKAAQEGVIATRDSIIENERALETQERAYVGMSNVNTPDIVAVNTKVGAFADVVNFGHSPAHEVFSKVRMKIFCGDMPKNPPYNAPDNPGVFKGHSSGNLMPTEHFSTTRAELNEPLTLEDMKNLNGYGCALYFYGEVTYCDIFGKSHYAHRCSQWVPNTPHSFVGCQTYNDGDESHPEEPAKSCSKP